ncbi:DUF5677 domain-containing protein [Pseudomonas aeruginosa]|uniref:DUF5677 domain-containing protein n=1 Tax=Pseudomonas aeruginosa TaxID=287 RepID=UPI0021F0E91A|nr:DUF5677 domain-containing protein [Pseudomonas aeruginosa]MCV6101240.1 DUF5677 domain-containing protein [Pseudomonas aeruginosa]MDI2199447.1 DUF5677 domain-containing protein [Pseudomonas aeruginosa]HBO3957639.1 hypothetical protein [Pseudomonas aeruginosa]HCF6076495.1 hypothetical protein [Pseudomonas aeruginosa]HEP8279045.1 hypothetical protein [Pseudomonas aeruginosa]
MNYQKNILGDFDILLSLMVRMVQAQAGNDIPPGDEWINDAQVLANKLFMQLCSARSLLNATEVTLADGQGASFLDHSSVSILARACLESYIVFHWIFQSDDRELRRFRHSIWRLGGLLDRVGTHPSTEDSRRKVAQTILEADELRTEIEASPYLSRSYTSKQCRKVLDGDWRIGWSWTDGAVQAGFNRKFFENVYGHLCGYAHSSFISTLQIRQAKGIGEQYMLGEAAFQICLHVIARFIHLHKSLFPASEAAFIASPRGVQSTARIWNFQGADMDGLYENKKGADPAGKGASGNAGS